MLLRSHRWAINSIEVHAQVGVSTAGPVPIGELEITDPDGTRRWGHLATIDQIEKRLIQHGNTGECADGSYFWATGLVILKDLEPSTVRAAVDDLVVTGEYRSALIEF